MALKTDYKDDVLNTDVNTNRTFNIVRKNGTVVEQDVQLRETTVFEQEGDSFGANDVNTTNKEIVSVHSKVCTNLLNPTLGTTTINGVTCTNNGDGTYTLSGTATGWAKFAVGTISIKGGVTYLASGCPSGGSYEQTNAYRIGVFNAGESNAFANDIGNGKTFKSNEDKNIVIGINIAPQTTLPTNLTFKPMLTTDLSATYDDFVAYSGDGELNQNVAEIFNKVEEHETRLDSAETTIGNHTDTLATHTEEIAQIDEDLTSVKAKISDTTLVNDMYIISPTLSRINIASFTLSKNSLLHFHGEFNGTQFLQIGIGTLNYCLYSAVGGDNGTADGTFYIPAGTYYVYAKGAASASNRIIVKKLLEF